MVEVLAGAVPVGGEDAGMDPAGAVIEDGEDDTGPDAGAEDGAVAVAGVTAGEEAAGLTGPGTGIPNKEQRLVGGVCNLQAGGSCWARAREMLRPKPSVKVLLKRRQRHCGVLSMTGDSSEQQAADGVLLLPVTYVKQSVNVSTTPSQSGAGAGACAAAPIIISSSITPHMLTPIAALPLAISLSVVSLSLSASSPCRSI